MASIENYIDDIYSQATPYRYFIKDVEGAKRLLLMELPISSDIIEVPLAVYKEFIRCCTSNNLVLNNNDYGKVVCIFKYVNALQAFKTINRNMQDILRASREDAGLVKIKSTEGNENHIYYGCQGLILDSSFQPVMTCSWKLRIGENGAYSPICPVLRVSLKCYKNQSNAIEKFIVKKMIPAVLNHYPKYDFQNIVAPPQIIIEESPFKFTAPRAPSIFTTNKELLHSVTDNIDDLFT